MTQHEGSSCAPTYREAVPTAAVSVAVAMMVRWGMAPCLGVREVHSMSFDFNAPPAR